MIRVRQYGGAHTGQWCVSSERPRRTPQHAPDDTIISLEIVPYRLSSRLLTRCRYAIARQEPRFELSVFSDYEFDVCRHISRSPDARLGLTTPAPIGGLPSAIHRAGSQSWYNPHLHKPEWVPFAITHIPNDLVEATFEVERFFKVFCN